MEKKKDRKKKSKKIIASRKTCKQKGTGLSHYVMLENMKK